jgi:Ca-activated chloride channel family protein
VSFTWPLLLLVLLVVPVVAAFAWWIDRRRSRYAVAFTNLDVLASVASPRHRPWRWIPLALFLLALTSASAALARPDANVEVSTDRATIVLLVDVSGSMRAADVKPTRLGAAQNAMNVFASKLPKQVKVGLVSFSTDPDVLVMPTTNRDELRLGISFLEPESGTAIGDGLALAVKVAKSSLVGARKGKDGKLPAAIVLLSDGAQTRGTLSPLQGAALARNAGLRVFTIALGTDHGRLQFGNGLGGLGGGPFGGYGYGSFPVKPDPVTLAAIAHATGGQTFRAQSAGEVNAVYKHLSSSIAKKKERREVSSWFAGAAAFLLLGALGAGRVLGEKLP